MFGFLGTRERSQPTAMANRVRLELEALESRYCPSAPQISLMAAAPSNNTVQLSGQVTDSNPASVQITISGVMSGTVTANSSGSFSFVGTASGVGTVSAVGVDGAGLTSNTAQTQVTTAAPTVQVAIEEVVHRNVTLGGMVADQNPGGVTVTFSGAVSGSTVTARDGSYSVTLAASGLGSIQAAVTDGWGLNSAVAKVVLTAVPPDIQNFGAAHSIGTFWTISGFVPGANTEGEVIRFSGLPSVNGRTATVDSTGHFYLTVELAAGENGLVSAYATDWWGQESNEFSYLITPTS